MIIQFPKRRHARTSAAVADDRRAARAAIVSAVIPFDFAISVARIAPHHSAGMRSRRRHFDTIDRVAPMSATAASTVGQSAITAANDLGGVIIESSIGQFGLNDKAKSAHDHECGFDDYAAVEKLSETEARKAFIARVKRARIARFPTQEPICTILGISQGVYKHYETRTPLPHRYIPKFVAATGVEYEWLLAAVGDGPAMTVRTNESKSVRRRKRAKAA